MKEVLNYIGEAIAEKEAQLANPSLTSLQRKNYTEQLDELNKALIPLRRSLNLQNLGL
jgi:hypothetical protein